MEPLEFSFWIKKNFFALIFLPNLVRMKHVKGVKITLKTFKHCFSSGSAPTKVRMLCLLSVALLTSKIVVQIPHPNLYRAILKSFRSSDSSVGLQGVVAEGDCGTVSEVDIGGGHW